MQYQITPDGHIYIESATAIEVFPSTIPMSTELPECFLPMVKRRVIALALLAQSDKELALIRGDK